MILNNILIDLITLRTSPCAEGLYYSATTLKDFTRLPSFDTTT